MNRIKNALASKIIKMEHLCQSLKYKNCQEQKPQTK